MAGKAAIYTIEELQRQLHATDAVHTGACIRMGWNRGKQVTKAEYAAAVESFRAAAAGRSGNA